MFWSFNLWFVSQCLCISGFSVTASTTLVARHVIAVAPASTSTHGNQPRLTVPMNVNVSLSFLLKQNNVLIPAGASLTHYSQNMISVLWEILFSFLSWWQNSVLFILFNSALLFFMTGHDILSMSDFFTKFKNIIYSLTENLQYGCFVICFSPNKVSLPLPIFNISCHSNKHKGPFTLSTIIKVL